MMQIEGMPPVHPAAEIYPLLTDEELTELAGDIKAQGQKVPILMYQGAILDGRNRWRACSLAGVEPLTQEWDGRGDPLATVDSLNGKRRQLTAAQKSAVAAAKAAYYEKQAEERRLANLRRGPEGNDSYPSEAPAAQRPSKPIKKRDEGQRSAAKAAKSEGAGVAGTRAMSVILKKAKDVWELARDGMVTTEEAKRLLKLSPGERERVVEKIRSGEKPPEIQTKAKRDKGNTKERPTLFPDGPVAEVIKSKPTKPDEFSVAQESAKVSAALQFLIDAWPEQHRATLASILKSTAERIAR